MKVFLRFFLSLSLGLAILVYPVSTAAQQILFTDDFTTGFEKWVSVRGNDGLWQVVDGQARAKVNKKFTIIELVPADQYWDQSWHNYEFALDYTPISGVDRNLGFGFENTNTLFDVHFFRNGYELVGLKNGQVFLQETGSFILENNHTYRVKIILENDQIKIKFDEQTVIATTNPNYQGAYGKISLKASTGSISPTEVWFDNIVVQTLSQNLALTVPLYKQDDPQWALEDYDHLDLWQEGATIKRWGCALTSAVMILRYHGITLLPNEHQELIDLTPASLNTWLKQQADGYLGAGLLNWAAISRLTMHMSSQLNTPKLEYRWLNFDNYQSVIADLQLGLPSILKTENHFVVAAGLNLETQQVLIKDPYFTREQLPETTPVLSSRHFYPSQTDLSYIIITTSPQVEIDIADDNNNQWTEYTENLTASDDESNQTPALKIYQTAKPVATTLDLLISQTEWQQYQATIYVYNPTGEVEIFNLEDWVGNTPHHWQLIYQPDNQPTLTNLTSFSLAALAAELELLNTHQLLTSTWVKNDLNNLINWAQAAPMELETTYRQLIKAHLLANTTKITDPVINHLLKLL